jgi:hypothetical protein
MCARVCVCLCCKKKLRTYIYKPLSRLKGLKDKPTKGGKNKNRRNIKKGKKMFWLVFTKILTNFLKWKKNSSLLSPVRVPIG